MLRYLAAGLAVFTFAIMVYGAIPVIKQRQQYAPYQRVDARLVMKMVQNPANPTDIRDRIITASWDYTFDSRNYSKPLPRVPEWVRLHIYDESLRLGEEVSLVRKALVHPDKPDELILPERFGFLHYWLILGPLPLFALALAGLFYQEPRAHTDVPTPIVGIYHVKPRHSLWYRRWALLIITVAFNGIALWAGTDYLVAGSDENRWAGVLLVSVLFLAGLALLVYTLHAWWMDMRVKSATVRVTRLPMLLTLPVDVQAEWHFARGLRLASARIGLLCHAARKQKHGKLGITMRQLGEPVLEEWNEVLINKMVHGGERLKLQRTFVVPAEGMPSSREGQKVEPIIIWHIALHLSFADGPDWERLYPVVVSADSRIKVVRKEQAQSRPQPTAR
jgi:hypothetical protein